MKKRKPISAARRKKINLLISQSLQARNINKKLDALDKDFSKEAKTERNALLDRLWKLNTVSNDLREKLGTNKKDNTRIFNMDNARTLGHAWDKKQIEDEIFKGKEKRVNGKSTKKNSSELLDTLSALYKKMGSKDFIALKKTGPGEFELKIVDAEVANEDEENEDF